jgi:ABC-type Fe3+/spermidine/putrescine transport system ATPase subunit
MGAAIAVEGVFLRAGATEILRGLSLEVRRGEVLAVLGPSGSGKTSLVRVILGLACPERGAVRIEGELVSGDGRILRPPEERKLAVVFQELALWPHFTVRRNLSFGLEARGVPRAERARRIESMLARVGLSGKEERRPAELSGGERQRVALARALVLEPVALLLDEPLASVDVELEAELLALFDELFRDRSQSVVFVTHDPREAIAVADRIAVLREGRVVQVGAYEELRRAPRDPFVEKIVARANDGHAGPTSVTRS